MRATTTLALALGLALTACTAAQGATTMPRIHSALDATKATWRATCEPTGPSPKLCEATADLIDRLGAIYNQINDALAKLQQPTEGDPQP